MLEEYRLEIASIDLDLSDNQNVLVHRMDGTPAVQRWHPEGEISRGGFGTVRAEREEESGSVRAVKVIEKAPLKEIGSIGSGNWRLWQNSRRWVYCMLNP